MLQQVTTPRPVGYDTPSFSMQKRNQKSTKQALQEEVKGSVDLVIDVKAHGDELLNGCRVSVMQDEKILEAWYTTRCLYLTRPLHN